MADVLWFLACLLVAWLCLRAARDYRDTDPQPRRHSIPAAPDNVPGVDDTLLAACQRIDHPDHDPNHRTTKGDQ